MASLPCQSGILQGPPAHGRSLTFRMALKSDPGAALKRMRDGCSGSWAIVGLGEALVLALGAKVSGLRPFPAMSGPAATVPSIPQALWILVDGKDRSETVDRSQALVELLSPDFLLEESVDTFTYAGGRDLTDYEDGTENPKGDNAIKAAIVPDGNLKGSSFVAIQRWVHDLLHFRAHTPDECDAIIGRCRKTNEELSEAPASAHVKRSAQESFDPPAFMLRRSMPWSTGHQHGLEFIAFGHSFDAYEAVMRRMAGLEDGLAEALFRFSRPINGAYYWCPPMAGDRLDFTALKLS
jgi:putative iron-dependent peroxidase